ncbi:putative glycosyl transferase [compost metagenome]
MNRLIFVCQVFYPDTTSASQLFSDLLEKMAASGTQITVVCGYPAQAQNNEPDIPAVEHWRGIEIRRFGFNLPAKRSIVDRALSYGSFLAGAAGALLRRGDPQTVVLGVTNPPFVGALLWLTSVVKGFPYFYLLHDLYPEGLIQLNKLAPDGLITRLWIYINLLSYRRAKRLLVLGRDMAELIQSRYPLPPEKLAFVPNWSAAETPVPLLFSSSRAATRLGLENKFVVQYSGNMGLWHDIETIIQAAALLRTHEHIHFLLIGDGIRRASAEQLTRELNLRNVTWMNFVPLDELIDSLSCSHVSLISMREGLEGVAVPCKLYGILATGRAIVGQVPANSEIARVLNEEACGRVTPPGNAQALAEAVVELASTPTETTAMGERAFRAYQTKYTVDKATSAFRTVLFGA